MTKPDQDRPAPEALAARPRPDDRLARALRENLKRRKAARRTPDPPTETPSADDSPGS